MTEQRGYLFVGGIAKGRWIATEGQPSVRVVVPEEITSLGTTHRDHVYPNHRYHMYFRETISLFGTLVTVYLHEDDRLPGAREWAVTRALLNEDGRAVYEQGLGDVLSTG